MKIVLLSLGIVSLALGFIGVFVPLLPTTPFALLSAYLFARSSPKLHNWLLNNRVFGKYIRDYNNEKSIPLKIKIVSVSMLWSTILFSVFYLLKDRWYLQLLLVAIALGVSFHILSLKTKKEEK
ncbi:MAG: YbaN family protein [Paludibacter sp.]|nr:YbaN family protein [Paludibacter sp.]